MTTVILFIFLALALWFVVTRVLHNFVRSSFIKTFASFGITLAIVTNSYNWFQNSSSATENLEAFDAMDLDALEATAAGYPNPEFNPSSPGLRDLNCAQQTPDSAACTFLQFEKTIKQDCQFAIEQKLSEKFDWNDHVLALSQKPYWVIEGKILSIDGNNLTTTDAHGQATNQIFRCWYDLDKHQVVKSHLRESLAYLR